jgi:Rps23 Pro-64 3,4-dihydroxylase Tpa1-like proline 4-hydroxylase
LRQRVRIMDLAANRYTKTESWESGRDCPIPLVGLKRLADQHRDSYREALPWRHLVLNNLVDPRVVRDAEAQELERALSLKRQSGHRIVKSESPQVGGEAAKDILTALRTPEFVEFLEQVTGVTDLVADASFEKAGLHVSPPGAFQALHRDFRLHSVTGYFHRVNVLVFLNSDWSEELGGELELWPADTSACGQRILPTAGKTVIFETTPTSIHGIPDPIRCPSGRARLSLASYYYTERPGPEDRKEPHFLLPKRPQDPWYMGIQGLKENVDGVRRRARKFFIPGRSAN